MPIPAIHRRHFLQAASTCVGGTLLAGSAGGAVSAFGATRSADRALDDVSLKGRLYKTLKIGMVGVEGTLIDKFNACKEAGFDGIEMDSPGMDVKATLNAIQETGLPVDGTVCSSHWNDRHTDSNPATRQKALDDLKHALDATKAVGGHTVLLVVGHGKDGPENEIWPRSIENIAKALPLASKLGVAIAIENVWNHFLYDHKGPHTQTADKFVKYVDELNSPWVGMQFDIGNHWKYGSMGDWIRQLGKRIIKLDVKGFSRANDQFTKITEGDLDWADVRKALVEINYHGWAAAEVNGGGLDQLKEISAEMDTVFNLR
ncbi:MAG: sugar phosphate isomerase/epimerase family protein [Pirellulaceae bacterium]|nr:sugar phosphate isomerase/epimerase family protein [Pirellulaceae bacterium]